MIFFFLPPFGLAALVMFLQTLVSTLERCSRRNRTIAPGLIFLNLIPVFNLFWSYYSVIQISASVRNEYRDRRIQFGFDFGKAVGIAGLVGATMALAALVVTAIAEELKVQPEMPVVGAIVVWTFIAACLGAASLFFVYWAIVHAWGNTLGE